MEVGQLGPSDYFGKEHSKLSHKALIHVNTDVQLCGGVYYHTNLYCSVA